MLISGVIGNWVGACVGASVYACAQLQGKWSSLSACQLVHARDCETYEKTNHDMSTCAKGCVKECVHASWGELTCAKGLYMHNMVKVSKNTNHYTFTCAKGCVKECVHASRGELT